MRNAIRCLLILLLSLAAAATGYPQLVEGLAHISFSPDARTFAVMAAINAAGFDLDADKLDVNFARRLVRARLAGLEPGLRERLRRFYDEHNTEKSDLEQQSKYLSYALLLGPPPRFLPAVARSELPADAAALAGFELLLEDLWTKGGLARLWDEVRPYYVEEVESYRPLVRGMILETLRRLRIDMRVSLDRRIVFVPEPLDAFGIVNARNTGDDYYVIVGPSTKAAKLINSVRHEYLHYQLDPLVAKYWGLLPEADPFLERLKRMPSALQPFRRDFLLMVTESLVAALEARLRGPDAAARAEDLVRNYDKGLLLAPYFDEELEKFEKGRDSILDAFPAMMEGVAREVKKDRDAAVTLLRKKLAARPAEGAPMPNPSPLRALLEKANVLLQERRFDEAEPLLEQALALESGNASALFGLAQIAGQRGETARALDLYEKAAARAGAQTWIAGWCYVHRGNIFRRQGDADRARAEYARVAELHGDLHGASEAAARALAELRPPPPGAGS